MQKILDHQDIVVYGKETERFVKNITGGGFDQTKISRFQVYCVLKNSNSSRPIAEMIDIDIGLYATSCSGTKVETNKDTLLGLKWAEEKLVWDEPNVVPDGAAFEVTSSDVLESALELCGLRNVTTPVGRSASAEPKCPVVNATTACTNSTNIMTSTTTTTSFLIVLFALISCQLF